MIIISSYTLFTFVFIVDTIGTIDKMIDEYSMKKDALILLGEKYYAFKITQNYVGVSVSTLKIKYGVSLPDSKREEGNIPLIASNGISDYVNVSNATNVVSFGCRGTLGNVFYLNGPVFVLNTAFYIDNPINYGNLYFALKKEKGLTLYQSGAAQPQITIDAIKNSVLKIPKNDNLNTILDCASIYEKIIGKLKAIKSTLFEKYF